MKATGRKKAGKQTAVSRRHALKCLGAGVVGIPMLLRGPSAIAGNQTLSSGGCAAGSKMDVVSAILSRRSYREFTGEPLADGDLQTILECGMAAPSANNSRPWEFVVLTTAKSIRKIPLSIPTTQYALKAGAAILVCADTRQKPGSHLAFVSTALSAQNMLLAATGLGYGCVWVELYPHDEYITAWQKLVNLPEHVVPLCLIIIGKPRTPLPSNNNTDTAKIHFEAW